jgi:MFS family permease
LVVVLPCGALLDRYGPRLIDSALLLHAAAGSLPFAVADGAATLLVGRALIGLGVAVGLMAGLKAIVLWFPPERVALANGVYIMLGALGVLSATGPAEAVVQTLGWRGLFTILTVASTVVALLIVLVVPERKPAISAAGAPRMGFLAQPGRSRRTGRRARRTARTRYGAPGRAASVSRPRGSASLPRSGWQPPGPFPSGRRHLARRRSRRA